MWLAASEPVKLAAEAPNWIPTILTGGGLVAFFRARPEGSKILVDAAQGAVIIQTSVITELRAELAQRGTEIDELRANLAGFTSMQSRIRELEHDNEILTAENTVLRNRQSMLERENVTLNNRVADLEKGTGNYRA
jgi:hypothetical protein